MPKNIVVFADGTGQEGGVGNNTNVYSLFNMIEDRSERQVSFYDRGLGTGLRKITGSIGGRGITKNVQECYEFISNCYAVGDQVYLFGFSRGATTVRTLAAFIHLFGILPRSRPELIKRAYQIYKTRNNPKKRRDLARDFVQLNHTMWCRIKFLGVWDTVAALGLPIKMLDILIDQLPFFHHSYHDFRLSESVDFARHALAIDDQRLIFHPTLWDETQENDVGSEKNESLDVAASDIFDISLVASKLKAAAERLEAEQKLLELGESEVRMTVPLKAARLRAAAEAAVDPVSKRVMEVASDETKKLIDQGRVNHGKWRQETRQVHKLIAALVREFNAVINGDSLYDPKQPDLFDGVEFSLTTHKCIEELIENRRKQRSVDIRRLNRLILQDTYSLKPANPPRIKQVWFAGMHTDVGGGYPETELAHIPLLWMIKEAMDAGLLIYPKHRVDLRPDAEGQMHDSREKLGIFYRSRARFWDRDKNQGKSPLVHESVIIRDQCEEHYEPWILKTKHDVEFWPKRLMSSVQFDDYHIWREEFWGFGSAFAVPWSSVVRISQGQSEIKLYTKDGRKKPIVIKGVSSATAMELSSAFESYKLAEAAAESKRRDALQEQWLKHLHEQDDLHTTEIEKLKSKIEKIENRNEFESDATKQVKSTEPRKRSPR